MNNVKNRVGIVLGCVLILIWCLLPVVWIISLSFITRCTCSGIVAGCVPAPSLRVGMT